MDLDSSKQQLVEVARSVFQRGLTAGTSGNISVKVEGGWLVTPTQSSMGSLVMDTISVMDADWIHIGGDAPTKEVFLHKAFYDVRPQAGAVVHLHSPYAVAVSCLDDVDEDNTLPPITPYAIMSFDKLPLVPYFRPGDPAMGPAVKQYARNNSAVLLANHGPVVSGASLLKAANAAEEVEQTARLVLLLQGQKVRLLSKAQQDDLRRHFLKG